MEAYSEEHEAVAQKGDDGHGVGDDADDDDGDDELEDAQGDEALGIVGDVLLAGDAHLGAHLCGLLFVGNWMRVGVSEREGEGELGRLNRPQQHSKLYKLNGRKGNGEEEGKNDGRRMKSKGKSEQTRNKEEGEKVHEIN